MKLTIKIKNCKEFECIFASDSGDIYKRGSKGNLIKLTQRFDKDGYLVVSFRIKGVPYTKRVHRLVASAFIPNPSNLPYVNHKDGNKTNPSVSNLEWCTARYNRIHALDNDLAKHYNIEVFNKVTKEHFYFNSYKEVAEFLGGKSNVSKVKYLCDVVEPTKGKYKHLIFIRKLCNYKNHCYVV